MNISSKRKDVHKAFVFIYKIHNLLNGKIYIGQTGRTVAERWKEHLQRIRERAKLHLYAALALYGEANFEVTELAFTEDQRIADTLEQFYIWYSDSTDPERGYNNALGGDGGRHSEKTKKLLSDGQKGKKIGEKAKKALLAGSNKGAWTKGKPLSPEHRMKISKALKGDPRRKTRMGTHWPEEHKQRMSLLFSGRKMPKEFGEKISTAKKNNPKTREAAFRGWETKRRKNRECL